MIYQFDQFELDTTRFELREEGAVQPLEPQVFTLLAYLIEHRERLVPKDELFENIWDGRIVTDSALTSRVKSARQAVGDCGKGQRFIKTIYGKGFRFVAKVQIAQGTGLMLTNASTYNTLLEGRVTELNKELARLRLLLVIAWSGMDSSSLPLERTASVYRRCAARLNNAVLTPLETVRAELESVKRVNQRPESKALGRFSPDSCV